MNKLTDKYSPDTVAVTCSNRLLQIGLNHNAAIIEYAASLIAATPVKDYRRAIKGFRRIHDSYNEQINAALADAEKELNNAAM